MNTQKTALLIIDAQFDFCNPKGALFVPGAEQDVQKIAQLIAGIGEHLDQIFVTLDTHQVMDIAHPLFWEDPNGNTVAPFTPITSAAVLAGKWVPRYHKEYVIEYLKKLEIEGAFQHFIWPEHCLIGSAGAALDDTILDAVLSWTHLKRKDYITVVKGLNPLTEHFGVFRAQVPIEEDTQTGLNEAFLANLQKFETIMVVGEARSHCVATSIKQILEFAPDLAPRVTVLTDCMSDVTNLGHLADPIFESALAAGVSFRTSREVRF